MTSFLTFGKACANPRAEVYAAMAKAVATATGTKHYYHFPCHDDAMCWPAHRIRQNDHPLKEFFGWVRFRWCVHDFRLFGIRKALRKHYYLGENWRRKDEKIYCGQDENGNKYWMARRSRGSWQGRFVEPADPHWLRGQDFQLAPHLYAKWLTGNAAHTPAQVKARGEWGHNSRLGIPMPFNIRHSITGPLQQGIHAMREPAHIPGPGHIVSPQYRVMEEAGFTKFGVTNIGVPSHAPFAGLHDFSEAVEEEFWRTNSAFGRTNKGNDHDEWRA